jgi:D-aminoacyl-tRNA deacylase
MRVVIQRVSRAEVSIEGKIKSRITAGLLVLLGIEDNDTTEDISWLCNKIAQMRIFNDKRGIMNLSVMDVHGEILVVSQFTLHASIKKGNRPSYMRASKQEFAIPMYEKFIEELTNICKLDIKTGVFGAMMEVELLNDGPVTLILDSKNKDF